MTDLVALRRRLRRYLDSVRPRASARIEIIGGLPDVPARWASVGDRFLEANKAETRRDFEARVCRSAAGKPAIFGGLPPLPGSEMTRASSAPTPSPSYWGAETPDEHSKPEPGDPSR
jgi:hypothetical protein